MGLAFIRTPALLPTHSKVTGRSLEDLRNYGNAATELRKYAVETVVLKTYENIRSTATVASHQNYAVETVRYFQP